MSFYDVISERLAALTGSATAVEARDALNEFNVRDIQAVSVSEGGGGGGGSQPHTQEIFYVGPFTINNATQDTITWTSGSGPDTLLDLAAPTLPTVIASGIYAFTLSFNGNDFTVGGYFKAQLETDPSNVDYYTASYSNLTTAAAGPETQLVLVQYLAAGTPIKVLITNRDGVDARGFTMSALIQRLG